MPAPKLSRQTIAEAAVELVDEQGLDALTMRRLGARLDVEAMSLYRHVQNKADLLDALHEAILSEMTLPAPAADWQRGIHDLALAFRDALVAHPNALPVFATRPAATTASLRYVEHALGVLAHAPVPTNEIVAVFQSLVALVVGHSCLSHSPHDMRVPPQYSALDPAAFPRLVEHGLSLEARSPSSEGAPQTAADELELGLRVFVAGIEARSKR